MLFGFDLMMIIKFLNEGFVVRACTCQGSFCKLRSALGDLFYYFECLSKGIENLTLGEELFFVDFDCDKVELLYNHIRFVKMAFEKVGEKNVYMCWCKREYFLPSFEIVIDLKRLLNRKIYEKLSN